MALFVLILFAALLAVVEPLDCYHCRQPFRSCSTNLVTCSNTTEELCISIETDNTLGIDQKTTSGSFKSCATVETGSWNNSFLFDFGDEGGLRIASQLCNATDCQANFDSLLIRDFYNGKYCPKCYKPGHSSCEDNGTVSCQGDFEYCSAIYVEMSQGDIKIPFAAKGCVSKSVKELSQKLPVTLPLGVFTYKFHSVSFQAANSALASLRRVAFTLDSKDVGPQVAFFFPCILGIFVVKIFS